MGDLEQRLAESAVTHLRRQGLKVTWLGAAEPDAGVDGEIDVRWPGGSHRFPVVIKRLLTSKTVALLDTSEGRAVFTDYVSPRLGEELSDAGWDFVDASGNASLTAPGLLVRIEGRRSARRTSPSAGLPFGKTGLPITFALLVLGSEGEKPTQRELAQLSGASLGSANRAVRSLRQLGYLSEDGRLLKQGQLSDRWIESYLVLRDEIAPGQSFTSDVWTSPEDVSTSLPDGAFLGSELAASVQGSSIRPETALVYAWAKGRQELIRTGRLRPAEDGWVRIRQPFWDPDLLVNRRHLPDFLIRADLLAEDDPRLTSLAMKWSENGINRLVHRVSH